MVLDRPIELVLATESEEYRQDITAKIADMIKPAATCF